MNKIISIFTFIFAITSTISAQWMSLPGTVSPIGNWPSISISDSSNIFIGGNDNSGSKIATSSNGGVNFSSVPLNSLVITSGRMVGCITALSPNIIFFGDGNINGQVISDARLYKSVNGGAAWTLVLNTGTNINGYFNGIVFSPTDPSFGITGSDPPSNGTYYKVWKTTDAGNNWSSVPFTLTGVIMGKGSMFCVNSSFYGFGSNHDFIYTKDGGLNWSSTPMNGLSNLVSSIAFDNSGTYGVGTAYLMGNSTISYTSNGGVNWVSLTLDNSNFSNAQGTVKWVPGTSVVFVTISDGNKTITYRSLNNGTNWTIYDNSATIHNLMDFGVYLKYGKATLYGISSNGTPAKISDAPLPVTLESFTYSVASNNVTLKWVTTEEINNAGFEIYRIKDGYDLNNPVLWTKIGYVIGKGNNTGTTQYSFLDNKLDASKYHYKLKQIDYNGNYTYYTLTDLVDVSLPEKFVVSQNYPNPFNPTTKIDYNIPSNGKVTLRIFDITGKEVSTLVNQEKTAGYYTVSFDASKLSSGNYIYKLEFKENSIVKILTLVK